MGLAQHCQRIIPLGMLNALAMHTDRRSGRRHTPGPQRPDHRRRQTGPIPYTSLTVSAFSGGTTGLTAAGTYDHLATGKVVLRRHAFFSGQRVVHGQRH